jgi:hypothetical protein
MRRTITLLVILLCCTCMASHASSKKPVSRGKTTARTSAAAGGASTNKKPDVLIAALDKLKAAANTEQPYPEAVALKNRISERLKDDYRSEAALNDLREEISEWWIMADKLCNTNGLCKGPLVTNVNAVDVASKAYFGDPVTPETNPGSSQPGEPPPSAPATDPLGKKDTQGPDPKLREEVRRMMDEENGGVLGWVKLGTLVATPILAFGLFTFAFISIRRTRRDVADLNTRVHQALVSLRTKHEGLASRLEGFAASDTDLFARLAELSAEIGAVDGRVRGLKTAPTSTPERGDGDGRVISPLQPEPPAFPVSADAYLRKMQRHATVVKPDFQNGILVADSENKGELVLVQDPSISHDALFIVPRVTQFLMKQDFYTYYERYYECERPASGTVWIVDPAVVERVQGGWELREKGVLEVR